MVCPRAAHFAMCECGSMRMVLCAMRGPEIAWLFVLSDVLTVWCCAYAMGWAVLICIMVHVDVCYDVCGASRLLSNDGAHAARSAIIPFTLDPRP
eukprot:2186871-Rhodomonas_salina.1